MKVTLLLSDRGRAGAALGVDPLEGKIRQVYFFDTPDLALNQSGSRRSRPSCAGSRRRLGREAAARGSGRAAGRSPAPARTSVSRSTRCRAAPTSARDR